jgi:hypothetical protein
VLDLPREKDFSPLSRPLRKKERNTAKIARAKIMKIAPNPGGVNRASLQCRFLQPEYQFEKMHQQLDGQRREDDVQTHIKPIGE